MVLAFVGESVVKNMRSVQEPGIPCLGEENPLEQVMANHPRILAWEFPWTDEGDGVQGRELQSMGQQNSPTT